MIPRFWCAFRAWRLPATPSASLVYRELQSTAQVRGVAFDTKELIFVDQRSSFSR